MFFDPEQLPKRVWLGATALMMLLAVLATTLFWPNIHPSRQGNSQQDSATTRQQPPENQPARPQLRQSAEEGSVIPWGGLAPGYSVQLSVTGLDPDWRGKAAFTLKPEGGVISHLEVTETDHLFRGLGPGRYRWLVQLTNADGSILPLTPPHAAPESFDFTVPPRILAISSLDEAQLHGSPIGDDLSTEDGAQLSAAANPLPEAVVDFEVKASGKFFDGTALQSAPVGPDGSANLPFQTIEGDYRWRARSTAPGYAPSAWVELRRTPKVDFRIVSGSAENPPDNRPPPFGNPPPPELPKGVSASSGSGGGRSQVLPSVPIDLPSFASLLLSPWAVGLALLFIGLAFWRWLRGWRGRAGRP